MSENLPKNKGITEDNTKVPASNTDVMSKSTEAANVKKLPKALIILPALLVLTLVLLAGYSHFHSQQQRAQLLPTVHKQTIAESLQEIKSNNQIDADSRINASVALGFQAYSEKNYKIAADIGLQYVDNPTYHKDITCNLLLKVYEAQHDSTNTKKYANQCIALITAETPIDPIAKGSRLHTLAVLYQKVGNTTMSKDFYRQFVTYIKDQKLEKDEVLSSYYDDAVKAGN